MKKLHPKLLRGVVFLFLAIILPSPLCLSLLANAPAPRPNILWITAEDISPNLGCYGDAYPRTPQPDAFARESVRYTRAFATSPVCLPARSCLITGLEATSLGTQRLPSQFPVPPTVLSLCGVKIPSYMQGAAFLGEAAGQPREFVFGARERADEVFDLARSVRDRRFLYIRNFMPHLSWMPPEGYSDASTFRQELKRLAAAGKLNAAQLTYAAPRKPLEELYDTDADPHQIHNLASVPAHRATLEKMRRTLRDWMLTTRDAGFLTEMQVWERIGANGTPLALARDQAKYPLPRLLKAADWVGRPEAVPRQMRLLRDADDGLRYWAAVGLHDAGPAAEPIRAAFRETLRGSSAVVRIEAAAALVKLGETNEPWAGLERELRSPQPNVEVHAARALQLLGDRARPAWPTMR